MSILSRVISILFICFVYIQSVQAAVTVDFDQQVQNVSYDAAANTYALDILYMLGAEEKFKVQMEAKPDGTELAIRVQWEDSRDLPAYNGYEKTGDVTFYYPLVSMQSLEIAPGFQGMRFKPTTKSLQKGMVVAHGSGAAMGGLYGRRFARAFYFAQLGYSSLSFCYFNCPYTENIDSIDLVRIDLRNIVDAIQAVKFSPEVKGGKVALMGGSRGAEMTSLLSTVLADRPFVIGPDVYIVDRPSPFVVGADYHGFYDSTYPTPKGDIIPWVWDGAQLENMKERTDIDITKVTKPYINFHGAEDRVWPVAFSGVQYGAVFDAGLCHSVTVYTGNGADVADTASSCTPEEQLFHFYFFEKEGHGFGRNGQILRMQRTAEFLETYM